MADSMTCTVTPSGLGVAEEKMRWRRCPRTRTLLLLVGMGAVLILLLLHNTQDNVVHLPSLYHTDSIQDNAALLVPSKDNVRHTASFQDKMRHVGSLLDNVRHAGLSPNKLRQQGFSKDSVSRLVSSQNDLLSSTFLDDVIGERHENVNVTNYLKCVDPEGKEQVQDLFCMKRPNFLSHFKNPCWVDWTKELQRLRCLPYFHVLGVDKSGTTDLHSRIVQHPHVLLNGGGMGKETYYWCWTRYGQWMKKTIKVKPFGRYLNVFEKPLAAIVANRDPQGYHPLITGDGTPMDFWDFRGWPLIPQNRGLQEPAVLTPHLMRHVYQDPRFILILRNPADRLYSDYFFLGYGWTPEEFREDVPKAIAMMERCMEVNTTRQCVYSNDTYINLPMRIHIGMYSVFMKEWLSVFPRSSFYVVRTEDYHADMARHLANIFQFLAVPALHEEEMQEIVRAHKKHETKAKKDVADMYPETRALLQAFYGRYNEELAVLLDDPRFLWLDV